ncbi:nitroreductase family protein [Oscillibacter sp.]|uniref:nitroreductase family protein n=1 Tax=Oscillibacter sp. TaxID=1945593 RepID=UPI00339B8D96
MNETMKTLLERRSIRKYQPRQVEDAVLNEILEAGLYAPSTKGRQSALIVLVQDRETIAELSHINAEIQGNPGADAFFGAPTVAVVLADTGLGEANARCDGALVMGNLMNAAAALGVGSCWINRAKETFERPEGKALLKKWGLPETLIGVGNCILGYADGAVGAPAPRRDGRVIRA